MSEGLVGMSGFGKVMMDHGILAYSLLSDFSSNRYVNIGLDGRHFACPDAKPDDLLPMDEQRWESGVRLTPFPYLPLILKFFLCHKG